MEEDSGFMKVRMIILKRHEMGFNGSYYVAIITIFMRIKM